MPKASWREAWKKSKKGKESVKKDAFKKWYDKKKKAKAFSEKKGAEEKKERRVKGGRGQGIASEGGKGRGRGSASAAASAGKGRGRGVGRMLSEAGNDDDDQGASAALVARLKAARRHRLDATRGDGDAQQAAAGKAFTKASEGARTLTDILNGKSQETISPVQAAVVTATSGGSSSSGKKKTRKPEESEPKRAEEAPAEKEVSGQTRSTAPMKKPASAARFVSQVTQLSQEQRLELFALNKSFGKLLQVRDLAGIREALGEAEGKCWANGHTYSAAVNALCRCGDWHGAEAALDRAVKARCFHGRSVAASGVIARTSMLRGYCEEARSLVKARDLLKVMEESKFVMDRPNTRTANTFLRGCLQLGAVDDAADLLTRMEESWSQDDEWSTQHGGRPDASSYETVVSVLSQALRYKDARAIAIRCLNTLSASSGSGAMFVAVARAAATYGDLEAASKAVKRAKRLLTEEKEQAAGVREKDEDATENATSIMGSGGKRGRRGDDEDKARLRSLEVFQAHRRKELLAEVQEIERFAKKGEVDSLVSLWARAVVFDDLEECEAPRTQPEVADALCQRVCRCFGLKADDAATVKAKFAGALRRPDAGTGAPPKKRRRPCAGGPRLDLSALFEGEHPLHLELCSGGGEWLVAQARLFPAASWVACELRFDRAARCFQRFALHGLGGAAGNAGVIAGDAREALEKKLLAKSCNRLFVNHPEPPHQTAVAAAADAAEALSGEGIAATHLLTKSFLAKGCGSVLKPGGTLTICSDSHDYGEWLLNAFASPELSSLFEDALKGTKSDKEGRKSSAGGFHLRTVPPSPELCGAEYTGQAGSSYFQKLKRSERGSKGQDKDRCFLCVRRKEDGKDQ